MIAFVASVYISFLLLLIIVLFLQELSMTDIWRNISQTSAASKHPHLGNTALDEDHLCPFGFTHIDSCRHELNFQPHFRNVWATKQSIFMLH